jgi:hypothetical protein
MRPWETEKQTEEEEEEEEEGRSFSMTCLI